MPLKGQPAEKRGEKGGERTKKGGVVKERKDKQTDQKKGGRKWVTS